MAGIGTTLTQHIMEREKTHAGASGALTSILHEIAVAAKVISREVNRAGLLEDMLGLTGETNVQGEQVQKLDAYSHETFVKLLGRSSHVGCLVSEEEPDPILATDNSDGKYWVYFDPLDGSSNIDTAISIGSIFSIVRRPDSVTGPVTAETLLVPGSEQTVGGYVLYGSSTVLVYTAGNGVHIFTLDPTVGEFILSHQDVRCPERGSIYSVNEGYSERWSKPMQQLVAWFKTEDKSSGRPYRARYTGSLVADFHRTLLKGGVFMYPSDSQHAKGKLRHLYEASPMAFICEQAGGAATNGKERLLDVVPQFIHEHIPLFVGSREDVARVSEFLAG